MNDLLLTDNDLTLTSGGDLDMVFDSDAVWQRIKVALNLWEGDYYYDVDEGVPYRIFFQNLTDKNMILYMQGFFLPYFYKYNIIRIIDLNLRVQDGEIYLEGILTDEYGVTKVLKGPINGQ
jgi:hypothetical protein